MSANATGETHGHGHLAAPWYVQASEGVLLVVALVVLALTLQGDQAAWLLWSDRDLLRTALMHQDIPTAGAELSFGAGGRVPGGALHYVLAPAVWLDGDPLTVWRWVASLIVASVGVLYAAGRRLLGGWGALLAVAMWLTSETVVDALWSIWNPALLPLFVAVAYAGFLRLVGDRDGRWLPVWVGGLALAAQMHFSGALLALAMTAPVVLTRPVVRRRDAALAVGVALLAYAPHLLSEVASGFANTHLLLSQAGIQEEARPRELLANLDAYGRALVGLAPPGATLSLLEARRGPEGLLLVRWALVISAIALAWACRRGERSAWARSVLGLAFLVPAVGAFFVPQAGFGLGNPLARRFLVVILPAAALLGAAGAAAVLERLRRSGAVTLAVGWSMSLTLLLALQGVAMAERWTVATHGFGAWPARAQTLDDLAAHTGWSLAEITGRTLLVPSDGPRFGAGWLAVDGADYLLHRQEQAFPGSLPPPCAAVYVNMGSRPAAPSPTSDDVARLLRRPVEGLRVIDTTRAGERDLVVLYTFDDGLCPTSMTDRYVLTSAEEATRKLVGEPGVVREVPGPDGVRRVLVHAETRYGGAPRPLLWAVDLAPRPGGLVATLHSNQLRGHGYNQGFLSNALIAAPRLVLTGAGGPVEVPVAEGWVGHFAAVTPLRVDADVPPGRWQVALAWDDLVGPEAEQADEPPHLEPAPQRVALPGALVVPSAEGGS